MYVCLIRYFISPKYNVLELKLYFVTQESKAVEANSVKMSQAIRLEYMHVTCVNFKTSHLFSVVSLT